MNSNFTRLKYRRTCVEQDVSIANSHCPHAARSVCRARTDGFRYLERRHVVIVKQIVETVPMQSVSRHPVIPGTAAAGINLVTIRSKPREIIARAVSRPTTKGRPVVTRHIATIG